MLKYKNEFFEIINQLTAIDDKVVIDKNNDRIQIKRQNSSKSIAYILNVPNSYLTINESIGFFKFSEFYRFFKTFTEPELEIQNNKLILTKNTSKFSYILNDVTQMKAGPKNVNFNKPEYSFQLTSDSLFEIVKMCTLFKHSKYSNISCLNNNIDIKVFMDSTDNTFTKTFMNELNCNDQLEFQIYSNIFLTLPSKKDFTVSIKKPGVMEFKLKDDVIDLCIYTAKINER